MDAGRTHFRLTAAGVYKTKKKPRHCCRGFFPDSCLNPVYAAFLLAFFTVEVA